MIAWKGGKLLQEEPAEVLIKNTELSRLKKDFKSRQNSAYEFALIYELSCAHAPVQCIFHLCRHVNRFARFSKVEKAEKFSLP